MEDTVTFKFSFFFPVLAALAFALGVLTGYAVWGSGALRTAPAPTTIQAPAAVQPTPFQPRATPAGDYTRYDIPSEGYASLGPEDAKIVIVEFSDYQCPYCRTFHLETFQSLLEAYPGQIRFVYRNLPLTTIHPEAFAAAVAAQCAREQDAFWQYHDKLFGSELLGEQVYQSYASELGLDVEAFSECTTSGRYDEFLRSDLEFAINLGVRSTPTFFINGIAIVGAQPLASFQQLIDKELAGEIPG